MKFTTTLEAVSSNKTKTTIKLSLSNAAARSFTANFLNSIDKELVVQFEDPQMEMDLQPAPDGRPGIVATINGQGEVERVSVMRSIASEDEDAESVLVQEGEEGGQQEEVDFEDPNHDSEQEEDENHDPEPDPAADAEPEGETTGEVDPQELERYILAVRPSWDDIPYDFPELIERKKVEGLAWYQVAKELNTSSTMLQAAYSKYKKRCKEQMLNGAA